MIDKMYINYGNGDIVARSSNKVITTWYLINGVTGNMSRGSNGVITDWYLTKGATGNMSRGLPDDNKEYSEQPHMENDVPIYNVVLDNNGALKRFRSENGVTYKAKHLKIYLDDNLDNQIEPVDSSEEDPVKDMVSSEFEYKIDKVNSALGALTFMEWQGVSHEMVVQAMNDVRDNIDAYLKTSM